MLSSENHPHSEIADTRLAMYRKPSILARLLFSGCSFGVFIGFILLARYLLLLHLSEKDLSAESIFWASTRGTVINSSLDKGDRYSGCHPDIAYRYQVAGKTFENNKVSYQMAWLCRDAETFVNSHVVNGPVDVHYRPDDPEVAVLLPATWDGDGFFIYIAILMSILVYFSLIFGAFGLLGLMPKHMVRYFFELQAKSNMFRQIWLFPLVALVTVILLPFMKKNRQNEF